ncbi:cuticle protein 19.8-like [Thrips palmi]|uniref:Cuticle protein 19.8-like n=1 Tax=Thrips palmi TaxID=161013 RepID=A0A6P8YPL5_THRPL|nr:cuticle protein 19.8-like [Thrips palmi]
MALSRTVLLAALCVARCAARPGDLGHYGPVAYAPAAPIHYAPAPVAYAPAPVAYAHAPEPVAHPKYEFKYGVHDAHTGDVKSQTEHRDGDVVKGEYSLVQPDGTTRTVHYTADDHNGFNAVVTNTGHAVHPEAPKVIYAPAPAPAPLVYAHGPAPGPDPVQSTATVQPTTIPTETTMSPVQVLVVLSLVAAAAAQYGHGGLLLSHAPVAVHHEPIAHPKYAFKYGVHDAHTGDVKDQAEERDGDVVKGEYSLIQPDGTKRTVHYTADHHNGFNAVVSISGHAIHPETPKIVHAPVLAYGHGHY